MKSWETEIGHGRQCVHLRVRIERYAFRCESCGKKWVSTYQVRDYTGPTGARWVVSCRDGRPVPAPNFGDPCPDCRRVSTTFDACSERPSVVPELQMAAG